MQTAVPVLQVQGASLLFILYTAVVFVINKRADVLLLLPLPLLAAVVVVVLLI